MVTPLANATDPAGGGYDTGDACGYVMGTSVPATIASGGEMEFDSVTDVLQACVNENGYFEDDGTKHSYGWSTQVGWVDLAWSSSAADIAYLPQVDTTSGAWSGYGWNSTVGWIWFDWTCTGCESYYDSYRVHTDMTSGAVNGYAWNDTIGWISFDGLTQELPALSFRAEVDVFAINPVDGTEIAPEDVDLETAPFADGAQYYRVMMTFVDPSTGEYLSRDDISEFNMEVSETSDSSVCINQVLEEPGSCTSYGEAVEMLELNYAFSECDDWSEIDPVSWGGTGLGGACYLVEDDVISYNYFVYSGAPTSNMLGIDDDADFVVDTYTDRDGTINLYSLATGITTEKMNYFYDRDSERNKWALDSITFDLLLSNTDRFISIAGASCTRSATVDGYYDCSYDFTDDPELSFKPRFRNSIFQNYYDSANNDTISTDLSEEQSLVSTAQVDDPSDEYATYYETASGLTAPTNVTYTVYYAVNSESSAANDYHLFMDSSSTPDDVIDSTRRTDTELYSPYDKQYAIGYSTTRCIFAGTNPCTDTATEISYETAEQWVCDEISEMTVGEISCYYTGYLELQDRHVEAEDMLAIGAINSSIDANEIISEDDGVSVLGITNYITLRNSMYAQAVRLIRGQTATGGGTLNATMRPATGSDIKSLMGGDLLYTSGSVTIDGSTSFDDKTLLVVGGNVYIKGNITGGKLGIVAFKRDGVGGNVYIAPGVTDINANIFIDGSLFSYKGSGTLTSAPTWTSDEERTETLLNQLYLVGSLVSRNTIGGAEDTTASSWGIGDGTTVSDYDTAREYDLNQLREFRLCYELDASGNVDTSSDPEDCNEGESRSSYVDGSGDQSNSPFIIEYDPPSAAMPIFNTTSPDINQR